MNADKTQLIWLGTRPIRQAYNDRAGSAVCQGQFLNDGV